MCFGGVGKGRTSPKPGSAGWSREGTFFLCTHEAALRGFTREMFNIWQHSTCHDKHSSESIHWEESGSLSEKCRKGRGKSKITGFFFLVLHYTWCYSCCLTNQVGYGMQQKDMSWGSPASLAVPLRHVS